MPKLKIRNHTGQTVHVKLGRLGPLNDAIIPPLGIHEFTGLFGLWYTVAVEVKSDMESASERITPQDIAKGILGPLKELFKRNDKKNGDSDLSLEVGIVKLKASIPLNLPACLESLIPKPFGTYQFPGIWADGKIITITQVDDKVDYQESYEKTLYIPPLE